MRQQLPKMVAPVSSIRLFTPVTLCQKFFAASLQYSYSGIKPLASSSVKRISCTASDLLSKGGDGEDEYEERERKGECEEGRKISV